MWVFQGTCRHCSLKCCWNPWGRWVLGCFYPPCIMPACVIRVTICDTPGSGGFPWCGYTAVLCYLAPESGGGVHITTSALWILLFLDEGALMKASFILSIRWFVNAAMKVSIFFLPFLSILNLNLRSIFLNSAWTLSPSFLFSFLLLPLYNFFFF